MWTWEMFSNETWWYSNIQSMPLKYSFHAISRSFLFNKWKLNDNLIIDTAFTITLLMYLTFKSFITPFKITIIFSHYIKMLLRNTFYKSFNYSSFHIALLNLLQFFLSSSLASYNRCAYPKHLKLAITIWNVGSKFRSQWNWLFIIMGCVIFSWSINPISNWLFVVSNAFLINFLFLPAWAHSTLHNG